jgi:3-hydroxy-D-aspartate aldolase
LIADAPHLAFAGLQAYHGSAQHLRGWDERRQAIAQAAEKAGRTRDLLARYGIALPDRHRSRHRQLRARGGERALYRIAMRLLHLYGRRLWQEPRPRRRADQGLRAEPLRLGDSVSRPAEDRAIVDSGLKGLAFDSGPPSTSFDRFVLPP